MRLTGPVLATIEKADREALLRVVQRFMNAAELTTERDEIQPVPDMWANFLADAFHFSSYRPTKYLCLEGLATFLSRFDTPWTKNYLYLTITTIEDPSYMEYLAERLRDVGHEDIAALLDGVPDKRSLDSKALRIAIGGVG